MKKIFNDLIRQTKLFFKNLPDNQEGENYKKISRIELSAEPLNLLSWLSNQIDETKIYWSSRDGSFEAAGVGAANLLMGNLKKDYQFYLPEIKNNLIESSSDARYYGGVRFQRFSREESKWKAFGCCRFVLPRFEIVRKGEEYFLAVNIYLGQTKNIQEIENKYINFLSNLNDSDEAHFDRNFARYVSREDMPEKATWNEKINKVLDEFKTNGFHKVVLARKSDLKFDGSIDPVNLLEKLKLKSAPGFHFLIQPEQGTAFIGASPECLYKRSNGKIYSEALAGTRPRGSDQFEDIILEQELLNDPKEIREHQSVSKMVYDALLPICEQVEKLDEMSVLKLTNVQHLISRFRGYLTAGIEDYKIIEQLHPTPAVGGVPRKLALERIVELEGFDRGWYAGPVGWINSKSSEFCVAIRSALLSNGSIALYAGSGIVPGSKPESEWEEIENKILNFKRLLHIR